jgi:hypothetical protein
MAQGVAVPTIPVSNDVILGEFKVYENYGLASQLLIGATRGGCKLNIERNIKEIKFDGAYGFTLDANGQPLVRYDRLISKLTLEQLYLKYYNKKLISNCDSGWESQNWGLDGGVYTQESTIVSQGNYSAKMTADTTLHGIHEVFTASKDLTTFDNAETSVVGDYIGFSIYISSQDLTDLGTSKLRLTFHGDSEDTLTNYYYYDVEASSLTAGYFNSFKVLKSAFVGTGSPNWNAITGVSLTLNGAPSAETIVYIDNIELIQAGLKSTIVNGFDNTNETTYIKYVQSLEIADSKYLENITLVGQRVDGKMIKIVLKHCLNDGNISLGLQEKDEVVNSTEFTSHYSNISGTIPPVDIYEYV